ncbi:hypothetical protein [Arcobacter aquimarinus]|uniref:Uncharacterized protein n=1 Tax=Arcobacter aquimarinus TaxID=1315211 RepID=A0AAE7B6F9_9BACT|nr:hypothetical protein [Arcobacter aquimarinus]QKE26674.1 hypothetical protein AAQM_1939 [Arcobacter aquimarinus]RXI33627.1 hypothetical protein CP986_10045 [Arcobacter aquimarinus]
MNYNIVIVISVVICAIISLFISYYLALFIVGEDSNFFKALQLIIAIISMTTFYAPTKHIIIKFMNLNEDESENK